MTLNTQDKPRRTALYTPGANLRALDKAVYTPADVFIIDLEDAVAPDSKDEARKNALNFLAAQPRDGRDIVVRVNGLDTPWCEQDVKAIVGAVGMEPHAILFPKVNNADDVRRAERLLAAVGAPADLRLWCMIETPLAILNLHAIGAESRTKDSRMSTWVMGTNDLAKDMRARLTPGRPSMLYALSAAVTAARAFGLTVLDGVYNDLSDTEGLVAEASQAKDLGFDGKTTIHPSQVAPCNTVYSPTPEEVANAQRIVDAFALPENANKGVIRLDGKMVELLHAQIARRTLAISEAIAAREIRA
jgi:citrate lyase subunit beta / citryl-CoA lyase